MSLADITAVPGIRVGHATDPAGLTGVTAVLVPPEGAVAAVDVRGAAPATRETDVLAPGHLADRVHAVLLCGGSAFGLAAADGAMAWLAEQGVGFPTPGGRVPIVPAAALYDLTCGPPARPDPAMGRTACAAAGAPPPAPGQVGARPLAQGNVGAGTGCTVGKLLGAAHATKAGLGSAAVACGGRFTVGALVAVNAAGQVQDPATGRILAGVRAPGGGYADLQAAVLTAPALSPGLGENTTIGVVATDAPLTREQALRLAAMAHDGLARTLFPAHSPFDGDCLFVLATGRAPGPVDPGHLTLLGAAAVLAVARAVVQAVRNAAPAGGFPAGG